MCILTDFVFYSQDKQSTNNVQSLSEPSTSQSGSPTLSPAVNSPQEQLLNQFMQVTKMNQTFSKMCLTEFQFDANKAYEAFLQSKLLNRIPPEAFIWLGYFSFSHKHIEKNIIIILYILLLLLIISLKSTLNSPSIVIRFSF